MIGFVAFSIKRAWQGFWRNALMSFAATATMVLMLLLLSGFWIVQTGLLSVLDYTEQKVEVIAYFHTSATTERIADLQERVEAMPEVESAVFVSRDEALENFRASLEAQGREDLTRYLDTNPLYASLEVKLTDPRHVRTVNAALERESMIRNVLNVEDLVANVVTVTGVLRTGGSVLLVVVGVIVLFIIVNTIRLAVFARAEEIEIMRLVGASDAFIRWPFVFEGSFVGLLGSLVTLGVLFLAAEPLGSFMTDFFKILPLEFGSLTQNLVLLVLGAGVGLGIAGSWLSVRTYLIR